MADMMAGAEPYSADPFETGPLETGPRDRPAARGVLLCHGFTGSPASMVPWARDLAERGYRVRVPLLPGHGTRWQDLNATEWRQWYDHLESELDILTRHCTRIAIAGLSMGGCLALRLAQERHDDVDALVLVNPALRLRRAALAFVPLLKHVIGSIPGISNDIAKPGIDERGYNRTPLRALASQLELWRVTREHLDRVDQPVLFFKSVTDHVVDDATLQIVKRELSSVEYIDLHNSYHVATLDYDADEIFTRSADFLAEHLGDPDGN